MAERVKVRGHDRRKPRQVDLTKKRDKATAAYRTAGVGADNCANCQHARFQPDATVGGCQKVTGMVERAATCDLFLAPDNQLDA